MSNEKKVSIIMPIYNTGIYLNEALDCLINQTLKEIEIICVNDASDDELTLEILHRYESYNIIKIINLEKNVGAGEARNIGIQKSNGEYLMFLDSDDLFELDLIEQMYNAIFESQADVAICGYNIFRLDGHETNIISTYIPNSEYFEKKEEGWLDKYNTAAWNKICKKDYIKKNNIKFQNYKSWNDIYFSYMLLLKASKIVTIHTSLIRYRLGRNGQISEIRNPEALCMALGFLFRNAVNFNDIKEILIVAMNKGLYGIMECKNEDLRAKVYVEIKMLLEKYYVILKEKYYNYIFNEFQQKKYSYEMISCMSNYCRLKEKIDEINNILFNKRNIGLWGYGCRGKAFLRLCREENIFIFAITDINFVEICQHEEMESQILSNGEFLDKVDNVVACNHKVRKYLIARGLIPILDLEDFSS